MGAPKYLPHYTVEDYRLWEGEWELWHGVPVAMTPSSFMPHQLFGGRLYHQILTQLDEQQRESCVAVYETDWVIRDDLVVRPDISVVCDGLSEKFIESTPQLLIEVLSEATREKDRVAKKSLYEEMGVKHYLIADPDKWKVVCYSLNRNGKYEEVPLDRPFSLDPGCEIHLKMPIRPAQRKSQKKTKKK